MVTADQKQLPGQGVFVFGHRFQNHFYLELREGGTDRQTETWVTFTNSIAVRDSIVKS